MRHAAVKRRQVLGLMGVAGAAALLPGCGGAFGNGSGAGGSGGDGGGGRVKVGLLIPQAGVYAPLGEDMRQGWDLWLEQNGGSFGDHEVETVVADEGEGPQTGVAAAQRLLNDDQCDVIVGNVSSAVALGVADLVNESKTPLIVANAGAGAITADNRSPYIWRTSFTNAQIASAMGRHMATLDLPGGVYVLVPDYAAGEEVLAGFTQAFTGGGGTIAGEDATPFGTTQDFQPFLSGVRNSGASATFCFYAGAEAVAFVQQYHAFGLSGSVPLYGSGFLTEGGVLDAQGAQAVGVQTTLHYSTEIDTPANGAFVEAHQTAYSEAPTVYAVQTYDAAEVLARALETVDDLTGDAIVEALDGLGTISSPRGDWEFDGQSPRQEIYLRTVEDDGGTLVNAVTQPLGTFGQTS